jgi:sugar phosphate permease
MLDDELMIADKPWTDEDGQRESRVRYQVLFAACSLAVLGYLHRVGFAMAAPELKSQLGLSDRDLSHLMAAFMVAYGVVEIPCGLIGDRLGVRNMLAILVVGWSILTGAIAGAGMFPTGSVWPLYYLMAVRVLFGMFQGGMFPSISRMMTDWMPVDERATAQGLIWMSSRLGGSLAPLLVVALIHRYGTGAKTFWALAAVGGVWCAGFWPWFRNRPEEMRGVTFGERLRIEKGRPAKHAGGHLGVPWRTMATSLSVWSLCLMYGSIGFTGNFFLTLLPAYLRSQRHFSPETTSRLAAMPLACGVVGCVLGGFLSDALVRRTGNRKWGRRLVGAFGLALGAIALLGTIRVESPTALGILLSMTFFGNDLAMGPAWAACADIGERYAGTLGGTMNMVGSLTGALGAMVIGALLDQNRPVLLFEILAGVYACGVLFWMGVDVTKSLASHDRAAE